MRNTEELHLPQDPGDVPATLRAAFTWVRDSDRASAPTPLPDDATLESLADDAFDDESRLIAIDQMLGSREGAQTLAHVIAARSSTAAADEYFERASEPVAAAARNLSPVSGSIVRSRTFISRMKPLLLAASLMLVAGTSWYVFSLPRAGDEVRSADGAVELVTVPPSAARTPITLRWRALRSDVRYSVEVLDANDAPVFANETSQTQTVLPATALKPGTYRWYVRARASDGTEVRSRVESFSVRG